MCVCVCVCVCVHVWVCVVYCVRGIHVRVHVSIELAENCVCLRSSLRCKSPKNRDNLSVLCANICMLLYQLRTCTACNVHVIPQCRATVCPDYSVILAYVYYYYKLAH